MKNFVNIMTVGDWEGYHRKEFVSSVINEISSWSDTIILQAPLSLAIHTITKFKKRFLSHLKGEYKPKEIKKNVYIFTPVVLFHHYFWIRFPLLGLFDCLLIRIQFDKFFKDKYKERKKILWIHLPRQIYLTKFIKYDILVYDSFDDNELDFDGNEIKREVKNNKKITEKADLTICVAKYTFDKLKKYSSKILYLPNGNNSSLLKKSGNIQKAEEIKEIDKPIIGYLGNIRNWIDFSLMNFLLEKYTEYTVIFIGGVLPNGKKGLNRLLQYNNFAHINYKSIKEIPKYLNFFNVGIIPFRINKFTYSVFPNKFFEYMAAEIPIVTTALPELEIYSKLIGYAKNKEEFGEYCEKAINGEFKEKIEVYGKTAIDNGWSKRSEVVNKELLNIVSRNII